MKTLILGRHAKSDWENPLWKDYERPLNARGLSAAPLMGKRLFENHWNPDIILTSYATRAATTAQLIAQELHYPQEKIQIQIDLYESTVIRYLSVLNSISDNHELVLSIGHNPSTSALIRYLTGEYIEEVPTCALACITFECTSWVEISGNTGSLLWYDYPKNEVSTMKKRF